ncbi:MAG: hypothetical protein KDD11_02795, partial [Acidobacteria bacterium]|nr:hypothetical protein [Acidobacteriota bacterium]
AGADTIVLPAGTYTLSLVAPAGGPDDDSVGDLDITESLDLLGAGPGTSVDADGDVTHDRVFHISDPKDAGVAVTMTGLLIEGGEVRNANGGGILVESGAVANSQGASAGVSLTLDSCVVNVNNVHSDATGPDGHPLGGSGGGIYSTGDLRLVRSDVITNRADVQGGGIFSAGPMEVAEAYLAGNDAPVGGALFETGSHVSHLSRTLIAFNTAGRGAGSASDGAVLQLFDNCTFHRNAAALVGGAIDAAGTVDLNHCTISENSAAASAAEGGAGLNAAGSGAFEVGDFRLRNTILAENYFSVSLLPPQVPESINCGCSGGACSPGAQFLSLGHNLEDGHACDLEALGDLVDTDPQLSGLYYFGTHDLVQAINPRSPATDAVPQPCISYDERGLPRPIDGDGDGEAACDIGAYERQARDRHLIFDDFNAGDLSAWSRVVTDPGNTIGATAAAAYDAPFGLEASLNGSGGQAYVEDDSAADDTHLFWSFLFNANEMSMADNTRHKIFQAYQRAPLVRLVTLVLRYRDGEGMALRVKVHEDDGSWIGSSWQPISTSGPVWVFIEWERATAPGATDGILLFEFTGGELQTLTEIDNDAAGNVDFIRLGITGGADPGTTGSHFFDDVWGARQPLL